MTANAFQSELSTPPCLPSKRFSTFLMFIPVMVSTVSGKPATMFPISVVSFDGPLPSPLTKIILPVFFNGAAIFSASEGSWFICFFVLKRVRGNSHGKFG